MSRLPLGLIAAVAGVVVFSGCSGESGNLPDLPGKTPALAGSWAKSDAQANGGCLVIDETGDLVAIRGQTVADFPDAPDGIFLDGQWRTLTVDGNSIEYAGVGEAVLEGSTARLKYSITIRSLGANVVAFTTSIEGAYDGTHIVGTATGSVTSLVPGLPAPPAPEVADVDFVRSDC